MLRVRQHAVQRIREYRTGAYRTRARASGTGPGILRAGSASTRTTRGEPPGASAPPGIRPRPPSKNNVCPKSAEKNYLQRNPSLIRSPRPDGAFPPKIISLPLPVARKPGFDLSVRRLPGLAARFRARIPTPREKLPGVRTPSRAPGPSPASRNAAESVPADGSIFRLSASTDFRSRLSPLSRPRTPKRSPDSESS